ncbi:MAG: carboxypeptidase regulatory-like domain-containing protein [Deltaproteobacteria bacterium]|nr:carboxypeptidase regulatory-like domain-containing protein [Deltaproteobacteria bacterium]
MKSEFLSILRNLFLFTALMFLLAGCGTNNTTADSNTGAITAKLAWNTNSKTASQGKIIAKAADGVATVRIIVTGFGMTDTQKDFVAADSRGVIDGIPSGSGRTLKIQGLDSAGLITFQGEANNITVQAGQVTDIGIITMQPVAPVANSGGGKITGRVTNASGTPMSGVMTYLYTSSGSLLTAQLTDSNGNYTFTGFASGTYKVSFTKSGYSDVWYNGATSQSTATLVTITSPNTVSGIDGVM